MQVGDSLLNVLGRSKKGDDTIFSWFARCQEAANQGHEVVNATVGVLLEDDGSLGINRVFEECVRSAPAHEICAYAPLRGTDDFRDLVKTLALGQERETLDQTLSIGAIASPGGSGALHLAAANFANPGEKVLLRSRHWGPYKGFLREQNLEFTTWRLLNEDSEADIDSFEEALASLSSTQKSVMTWLNDPAHNPTGLSLSESERTDVFDIFSASATKNPDVGHTLLIDAAYALYADEPHGWAQTIREAIDQSIPWPENMQILFAVSLSKSHSAYGMRTGALVVLHPEKSIVERMETVLLSTGRGKWSATNRLTQWATVEVHSDPKKGEEWSKERDRLKSLLDERRRIMNECAKELNIPLNPTNDGFFAWIESDNPEELAEACAKEHVYIVPLQGGVRIGLCALPKEQIPRLVNTIKSVLE